MHLDCYPPSSGSNEGAFGGCLNLRNLHLGGGLEEIGVGAFYGCRLIQHIAIPPSTKAIKILLVRGVDVDDCASWKRTGGDWGEGISWMHLDTSYLHPSLPSR